MRPLLAALSMTGPIATRPCKTFGIVVFLIGIAAVTVLIPVTPCFAFVVNFPLS